MMEFVNAWEDGGELSKEDAGMFLKILAPFAPHVTEELWQKVVSGQKSVVSEEETDYRLPTTDYRSVHTQPWPAYDPDLIKEEKVTVVVQINGKVRVQLTINHQTSTIQSEVEKLAREDPAVQKWLEGRKIIKTIFVSGKLINYVIR